MKPVGVGSVLNDIIKNLGIEDRMRLESLLSDWPRLFGEPLASHTCPVEIRNGELLIHVDSPAWLNQLKFFRDEMLGKLRPYGIRDIRFKRGSLYLKRTAKKEESLSPPPKRALTDPEKQWIEANASTINDDELREQIRKAMEQSLSRKKG